MSCREAAVWLDERWYGALSRQTKEKDATAKDKLNTYLDARIDQIRIGVSDGAVVCIA